MRARQSHTIEHSLPTLVFCVILAWATPITLFAQRSSSAALNERDRGISLYDKGYVKEAIEALASSVSHDKTDPQTWRYLGLAHLRDGDFKAARKALEASIRLRANDAVVHTALAFALLELNQTADSSREADLALQLGGPNAEVHYILGAALLRERNCREALREAEAALQIDPGYGRAFLLKYQSLVDCYAREMVAGLPKDDDVDTHLLELRQAASSLQRYLELTPKSAETEKLSSDLETLRVYSADVSSTSRVWVHSKDADTRARIVKKPEPSYTDSARVATVNGIVTLQAIFAADGTVRDIMVLQGLPHGLTDASVKAARKIKFVPAMKDGRPVSVPMIIQYSFSIY